MKKKAGTLLMIIGTVLVGLALFLFAYNQWDANRAEKEAAQVVSQLKKELGKDGDSNPDPYEDTD